MISAVPDRFGGVVCTVTGLADGESDGGKIGSGAVEEESFAAELDARLSAWRAASVRGVWITLPTSAASARVALAACLSRGFQVHHATPRAIMLTRWLPAERGEASKLPPYASTYIGVGGIVLNAANELLVVRERYARDAVERWGLPGGQAERNEPLHEAVEREVREETGVRVRFAGIVALKHQLAYVHGCSDIYFVCACEPLTIAIAAEESEIADCRWMDVRAFLNDARAYRPFRDAVWQLLSLRVAPSAAQPLLRLRQDALQLRAGAVGAPALQLRFDIYAASAATAGAPSGGEANREEGGGGGPTTGMTAAALEAALVGDELRAFAPCRLLVGGSVSVLLAAAAALLLWHVAVRRRASLSS